jgi:chromosome segregation ATPase
MSQSVQNLRDMIVASETKSRELHSKLENLSLVEQDIIGCKKLMDECEAEQSTLEHSQQKLQEENDGVERKQAELRELNIKETQLKRQEGTTNDKLHRLHQQLVAKRDSITEKLEKLRIEWDSQKDDCHRNSAQINKFESQRNEMRAKVRFTRITIFICICCFV